MISIPYKKDFFRAASGVFGQMISLCNLEPRNIDKETLRILNHSVEIATTVGYSGWTAVEETFCGWHNSSNGSDWTMIQLATYVESFFAYKLVEYRVSTAVGVTATVLVVMGFLGYIAAAMVLRGKGFSHATFVYHKALVYLEGFNMLFLFISCLSKFLLRRSGSLEFCFLVTNICFTMQSAIAIIADTITICIAFERITVLWGFERALHAMATRRFTIGACIVSSMFGLLECPHFMRFKCAIFLGQVSNGRSEFYNHLHHTAYEPFMKGYEITKAVLLIVSCTAVVSGAIRWAAADHKYLADQSKMSTADKQRVRTRERVSRDLTALCFCIAAPCSLFSLHFLANEWYFSKTMSRAMGTLRPGPAYHFSEAQWTARYLGTAEQINLYFQTFWFCVAHASHFYLYCLFCKHFRTASMKTLRIIQHASDSEQMEASLCDLHHTTKRL